MDHGIHSTTTNSSPDHRQRSAQIAADQYRPLALVGHRKGRAKFTGFLDLLQRPRHRSRSPATSVSGTRCSSLEWQARATGARSRAARRASRSGLDDQQDLPARALSERLLRLGRFAEPEPRGDRDREGAAGSGADGASQDDRVVVRHEALNGDRTSIVRPSGICTALATLPPSRTCLTVFAAAGGDSDGIVKVRRRWRQIDIERVTRECPAFGEPGRSNAGDRHSAEFLQVLHRDPADRAEGSRSQDPIAPLDAEEIDRLLAGETQDDRRNVPQPLQTETRTGSDDCGVGEHKEIFGLRRPPTAAV